ncbi:hypothetical protein [Halorubrum laminariae]|uniref:Uncharacterized protein n=1 Tax=Halorubrum laminariae TaxID=1433523 RepID=A0ABD6BZZ7_9EURY|nr:hypothetical protein [Halorubrum laminariae]
MTTAKSVHPNEVKYEAVSPDGERDARHREWVSELQGSSPRAVAG